jgi:hypothetical protein
MKNEDIFNETKIELEEYLIKKYTDEESEMIIMMIEESEYKKKI